MDQTYSDRPTAGIKRTIVALFDEASAADKATADLEAFGIARPDIERHKQSGITLTSQTESQDDESWWQSLKRLFVPEEDTHVYAEAIRRGGIILVVHVSDAENDGAIDILEMHGAVDLDHRTDEWRSQGWTPRSASPMTSRSETASLATPDVTSPVDAATGSTTPAAETRIPIAREELRVGKREVSGGHVRIRAYVVEHPVEEQVALRRETVDVERRPATGSSVNVPEDAFRERTLDLEETQEEAVVSKTPVVEEELVVRKRAEELVQRVSDTLRETKVEVDDNRRQTPGGAAAPTSK